MLNKLPAITLATVSWAFFFGMAYAMIFGEIVTTTTNITFMVLFMLIAAFTSVRVFPDESNCDETEDD